MISIEVVFLIFCIGVVGLGFYTILILLMYHAHPQRSQPSRELEEIKKLHNARVEATQALINQKEKKNQELDVDLAKTIRLVERVSVENHTLVKELSKCHSLISYYEAMHEALSTHLDNTIKHANEVGSQENRIVELEKGIKAANKLITFRDEMIKAES